MTTLLDLGTQCVLQYQYDHPVGSGYPRVCYSISMTTLLDLGTPGCVTVSVWPPCWIWVPQGVLQYQYDHPVGSGYPRVCYSISMTTWLDLSTPVLVILSAWPPCLWVPQCVSCQFDYHFWVPHDILQELDHPVSRIDSSAPGKSTSWWKWLLREVPKDTMVGYAIDRQTL